MKKIKLISALTLLNFSVFAQGWVGNSASNSIYPVNSNLNTNPLSVGIGTNTPTEQLHSTLGVRFEGITQNNRLARILAQDNSGKLFWRDASTLITPPNNNFWSLSGNSLTNPGTAIGQNYLGTQDNQKLIFGTNATERMTILSTGQVGIGNTTPTAGLLTVGNGTAGIGNQASQLYTFQLLGKGTNAVEHLGFFNNDKTTSRSQLTVSNSGNGKWEDNFIAMMVHGSNFSYQGINNFYLNQNNSGYAMINAQSNATSSTPLKKFTIGVFSPNIPMSFYTNNVERVFINSSGQTGISTITPTAALHVNCTGIPVTGASNVRFENLQQGAGNYLVIDANGYVRKSASGSINRANQEDINAIKDELKSTRQELNELKLLVKSLLENRKLGTISNDTNMNSLEIIPTPFNGNAKAKYSIIDFKNGATLQILDINGVFLKKIPIHQAKGQIEIGDIKVSSGSLIFNIISDNKLIVSKISIKE